MSVVGVAVTAVVVVVFLFVGFIGWKFLAAPDSDAADKAFGIVTMFGAVVGAAVSAYALAQLTGG